MRKWASLESRGTCHDQALGGRERLLRACSLAGLPLRFHVKNITSWFFMEALSFKTS
ncbi:MAG: hypothetical protein Q6373_013685 [Candidatus Sigynarchaeota archaeon]